MEKKGFKRVCDAINTVYAAKSGVEVHCVMNAFRMAVEEKTKVMVLAEKVECDGDEHYTFVLMNDENGEIIFPLFTNITELRNMFLQLESQMGKRLSTCMMELGDLLHNLVDNHICDRVVVNPESLDFNLRISFYEDVIRQEAVSHITLINADITKVHTDVIVSSVREDGEIMEACVREAIGGLCKGEIEEFKPNISDVFGLTLDGEIGSPVVFFTRPPICEDENDIKGLYDCYFNCLNVAKDAEFTSVAFSCIGVEGEVVPLNVAIPVSTAAVLDWMNDNSDYVIDVFFCCDDETIKERYQAYFDDQFDDGK